MIGDHHGRPAGKATLLVRAADEILGTHSEDVLDQRGGSREDGGERGHQDDGPEPAARAAAPREADGLHT